MAWFGAFIVEIVDDLGASCLVRFKDGHMLTVLKVHLRPLKSRLI